jgi:hypothetical protein
LGNRPVKFGQADGVSVREIVNRILSLCLGDGDQTRDRIVDVNGGYDIAPFPWQPGMACADSLFSHKRKSRPVYGRQADDSHG